MCDDVGFVDVCGFYFDQIVFVMVGQFFDDGVGIFVIYVDDGFFDWFYVDVVFVFEDYVWM